MKLIITRHGETIENKQGIMQGHLPGKLSELGIEQAKKLAERLKEEKIDVIYSSDLTRAADTAKEIAKFHSDVPLIFTKELRERNLGELQGRNKSEFGWKEGSMELVGEKGETLEESVERAKKFLHQILHKHKKDTVLVIGHNGINKAIISQIIGKTMMEMKKMGILKNTCVNIFEIDENKNHKIILFNCAKHLT